MRLVAQPSNSLTRRFEAGNEFERAMSDLLVTAQGPGAIRIAGATTQERVARTLEAMEAGARLILGGQLPHDRAGGRVGKPDLLLLAPTPGHEPRYVPGEIKNYAQFGGRLQPERRTQGPIARHSSMTDPVDLVEIAALSNAAPNRFKASMQLAHYTRMLEACGFHPGSDWLMGAVLGTSDIRETAPGAERYVLGWFDLTARVFSTYSRSAQGAVKRSALERYDHEFGFRQTVVSNAVDFPGSGEARIVLPVWQKECTGCPYEARCWHELEGTASRDVTFETLSIREWKALEAVGVRTTAELAALDLDDSDVIERIRPGLIQTETALRTRLDKAIRRAQLVVAGLPWKCTSPEVVVPTADVEIDVDMENQEAGGLVYMWGARKRLGQNAGTASYVKDFHAWEPMDRDTAQSLALRYFAWLQSEIKAAERLGKTILFFHWSHPEVSKLRDHLRGTAVTEQEFSVVADHHVDLEAKLFKKHFFSLRGSGLKVVATALGFQWPDGDAGGEHSLSVVDTAQGDSDAASDAQQWLLSYNEADTAATAHIRDSLRTMDLDQFR